ncbi:hypothetical protein OQX61_11855 [Pedobacter sp. PLR]|uniref:hypothetical protein n=1 Tax=Pedobacter sp. PLR TaxID=2994465 RepID=UPI00224750AA|nr:hypothetical protein [Pedobacter sp. PLR]MCX2451957.1 hypothetical protein [Pedobacter sp. PLR]
MRLIREINSHEMLRRWAIAEVYVEYLDFINETVPRETLQLLYSNDRNLEKKGISKSLKLHHLSLVDCLPSDVSWYLAGLEITKREFNKLQTIGVEGFAKMTNASYQVADAAKELQRNPGMDLRIEGIKQALQTGSKEVQWLGITLLASGIEGPFTIVEGNGRLISLYQLLFLENNQGLQNCEMEVVLGISDEELKINVKYLD